MFGATAYRYRPVNLTLFLRGSLLTDNYADGDLGGPKHHILNLLVVFLNGLRWSMKSSINLVLTNAASWLIPLVLHMRWPLQTDILTECAVMFVCWPLGSGKEVSCTVILHGLMTNDDRSWLQVAQVRS